MEVQYLIWIANMVPVKKKNEKTWVYNNFQDLTEPVARMTSQPLIWNALAQRLVMKPSLL